MYLKYSSYEEMDINPIASNILKFWFPNNEYQEKWFDGSVDHYILENYSDILKDASDGKYDSWIKHMYERIALIIVLDQFTRNIYRGTEKIRDNDKKALEISKQILENNEDVLYPISLRIFILLPYRHARKTNLLDYVMKKINEYSKEELSRSDITILKRFKNATISDYSKVTDTINYSDRFTKIYPEYKYVLDDLCKTYTPNLEKLLDLNKDIEKKDMYKIVLNWVIENMSENKLICVSLSGGVDSMVLLYIFYQMKLRNIIDKVVACHVDYGNRSVSKDEADYTIAWSEFFGIPIYWRQITHIKRCDEDLERDFYEEETKKIRFGLYKYVIAKEKVFGICLGHHNDDLAENVLMNIFRGRSLLDLYVMKSTNIIDGVTICRPMLDKPKKLVYEIAHTYCVPYMKDTTSPDCFRGFLRTKIFDEIEKFDPRIKPNIIGIGKESVDLERVMTKKVIEPILKSVNDYLLGFSLPRKDTFSDLPISTVMRIFTDIFHKHKTNALKHKCLKEFIEKFVEKNMNIMFVLNNKYICIGDTEKYYMIDKQIMSTNNSIEYEYTKEKPEIIFGNWKIIFTEITDETVWKKDKITYEDIAKGTYSYSVPITNNKFIISNSIVSSKCVARKLYTKVTAINKYLPKVSEDVSFERTEKYVMIEFVFLFK